MARFHRLVVATNPKNGDFLIDDRFLTIVPVTLQQITVNMPKMHKQFLIYMFIMLVLKQYDGENRVGVLEF
jgi:hypothetical protein